MKHIRILLPLLLVSSVLRAQEIIPNGNLETWDFYNTWTLEPQYWETPNNQLTASVVQDSAAFEGQLAMRVNVQPGFEGGIMQEANLIVPLSAIPDGMQPDPSDIVKVEVRFYYEDAMIETSTWTSLDTIAQWQEVTMVFAPSTQTITEAVITVSAGYTGPLGGGSWDTWISVDDFYWTLTETVEEPSADELVVYPNPANKVLNVVTSQVRKGQSQFFVYDMLGKKMTPGITLVSANHWKVDVTCLTTGVYWIVQERGTNAIRKQFVVID
jgi:Secretion system C-terminal sorting domain